MNNQGARTSLMQAELSNQQRQALINCKSRHWIHHNSGTEAIFGRYVSPAQSVHTWAGAMRSGAVPAYFSLT